MKTIISLLLIVALINGATAQTCSPEGDQTTYGSNNVWKAYMYRGINFNNYSGYTTVGTASNPSFYQDFGGSQTNFATNGCPVYTDTFSVRYKLTKYFTPGNYQLTVGGDDGFRLSVDGGATWVINQWSDHGYYTNTATVALSGNHNLVLEYFENYGANIVSFNVELPCGFGEDQSAYGNSGWIGYVYKGMNFQTYKGSFVQTTGIDANFDQNFGGGTTDFNTSGCAVYTSDFSVKYRMKRTLAAGKYIITVGADDGYRLSLDGGNTYVIDKFVDQGYNTTTYTAQLSGTYNMVLDYYENGGDNRVSFSMSSSATLPVKLISFSGSLNNNKPQLVWKCAEATDFSHFIVQKSDDGRNFQNIATVNGKSDYTGAQSFSYIDNYISHPVYYRLAMVDKDGSTQYSSIVSVVGKSVTEAKLYPTIVDNGNITIENTIGTKLEIYDMNGRMVFTKQLTAGIQQVSLQMNRTPGSYVARITGKNEVVMSKVIIVK